MKETIKQQIDEIIARVAVADIQQDASKDMQKIRVEAQKAMFEDVREMLKTQSKSGWLAGAFPMMFAPHTLQGDVQNAMALCLGAIKSLAVDTYRLALDDKQGDALRSLVRLSWLGGQYMTYATEAERIKVGGMQNAYLTDAELTETLDIYQRSLQACGGKKKEARTLTGKHLAAKEGRESAYAERTIFDRLKECGKRGITLN